MSAYRTKTKPAADSDNIVPARSRTMDTRQKGFGHAHGSAMVMMIAAQGLRNLKVLNSEAVALRGMCWSAR